MEKNDKIHRDLDYCADLAITALDHYDKGKNEDCLMALDELAELISKLTSTIEDLEDGNKFS